MRINNAWYKWLQNIELDMENILPYYASKHKIIKIKISYVEQWHSANMVFKVSEWKSADIYLANKLIFIYYNIN